MAVFTSPRGLTWHYDKAGSGEALLFIHGFAGCGAWWHHQLEFLKQDFEVIAIDLPGHGQSSWMPLSLKEMAKDLAFLVDDLGDANISIVASSFGGLVASSLHKIMPDRIMRMSFVGSIPKFARSPEYPAGLDIEKIKKLSSQINSDHVAVMDMFFRSLFTMKERDSQQFKAVKEMRAREACPSPEVLRHYLQLLEETDLRDRVAKAICPQQYITGSNDYICPPAIMEWIKEHTYNARFDTIQGCGHLPFLTEINEYNRLLEDFLLN